LFAAEIESCGCCRCPKHIRCKPDHEQEHDEADNVVHQEQSPKDRFVKWREKADRYRESKGMGKGEDQLLIKSSYRKGR
jgi:hypothetical protein